MFYLKEGEGLDDCSQITLKQEMNKLRYSLSRQAVAESKAAEKVPSKGLNFPAETARGEATQPLLGHR